ncbi:MAG: DUF2384 domain-containing protein [Pseudomonadota bacterium]|nr:DUF2384 domain-containing protein [Pseudomonadota bacterium]
MGHAQRQAQADPATVLTKATLRATDMLHLSASELAQVIGVSPSTVTRYRASTAAIAPDSEPGQLALLLIRVYRSLDPLVGSGDGERQAWMHTPNKALGGVPAQLVLTPGGLVKTLDYLDGMRAAA